MTTDDWLYLRAYGGPARHSLEIDPVLRTTAAWIGDLAPARWHFLRYVDVDGQHLRVRLRGPADAVDRWYAALPRLDAALAGCRPRERDRLLDDPLVTTVGSRRGTSLGVYSPEVHKYGTGSALDAAEDHFDASSRWCVDHGVWRWSAATRVAAAVHYLVGLADGLDATGADRGHQLLDRHRTHWGPRLRLAGVDTRRAREAQRLVRAADLAARRERPLEGPVAELVASHLDTGLATGPDPLRSFHLAHMDLNRIGVNPVEECLAGLVARALRDQQGPRTDHATVVPTGEEA